MAKIGVEVTKEKLEYAVKVTQGVTSLGIAIGKDADAGVDILDANGSIAIGTEAHTHEDGIAIGKEASGAGIALGVNASSQGIAIGGNSVSDGGISIGYNSNSGGIAIGDKANAYVDAIAIGDNAKANDDGCIQIGSGTNNDYRTVKIYNTTVLDENGKVPFDALDKAQRQLVAGTNIAIENNADGTATIRATGGGGGGTEYTAGDNIIIENNVISAIDTTKSIRFVDVLPQTGVENSLYLVPLGLPTDVARFVNLAYEHWGSLANYPHFLMFTRSNNRTCFLLNNGTNDVNASGNITGAGGLFIVEQNGEYTYSEPSYMAHSYSAILYSNADVGTTFTANVSADIDYSDGAGIPTTFESYKYNGSEFVKYDNSILKEFVDGTIKPIIESYGYTTISALTDGLATKQDANLSFDNITVATSDWVSDNTYSDYGYKAVLTCSGVTTSMVANVYFNGASAALGTLAPFCETGNNTVTIYCSANDTAVTIDRIEVVK